MCVFCDIAAGKTAAQIVYEDEICAAFLDIDPIQEGHVLLIPRKHYLDADEIPEESFAHMALVSRRLIAALKRAFHPDGYSVMQNGGRFNDIGHYHLHLFPRYEGDGFGWKDAEIVRSGEESTADAIRKML